MRAYIIRRLLLIIPSLFLVTIIVFCAVRFIPGHVIELMVAEMAEESGLMQELTVQYLKHELGMDVPIYVQYARWLGVIPQDNGAISGVFQGDLGRSLWTNRLVTEDIRKGLPISGELAIISIVTGLLIALPIGAYSAIRQDTGGDYIGRTIAILGISVPTFWIATIVMVYPSIYLNWAPPMQYIPLAQDPIGNIGQFLLPGFLMGTHLSGTTMRMMRTMMLEVLRQDYVRTAWAKGLTERTIIMRHILKNALIPVVTQIGLIISFMIAGTVIIEQIFCLPGIGRLLIEALSKRDYPVIVGINLVTAGFVLILNLLVDVSYAYLDPRIQYK